MLHVFAAFALLCHKQGSGLEEFNSWMTDSFFAEGAPFFDCLGDTEHASVKGILSTKWMWGQDTKRLPCAPTRNGLAQFLFLTSGQLRLIVILPSLFPPESAAMSLDETIEYVKAFPNRLPSLFLQITKPFPIYYQAFLYILLRLALYITKPFPIY